MASNSTDIRVPRLVFNYFNIGLENIFRTLFFAAIFMALEAVFSVTFPYIFSKTWKRVSEQQRFKLKAIFVSQFHCIVLFWLAFKIMLGEDDKVLGANLMTATTETSKILLSFSTGYFIWDTFAVIRSEPLDYAFLFHGIVCWYIFWVAQKPYLHYYAYRFLMFEAGTPLLNIRHFLVITDSFKKLIPWTERLFGLVYLVSRIIWGVPVMFDMSTMLVGKLETLTFDDAETDIAKLIVWNVYITLCGTMTALNLYWFYTMISGAVHAKEKKQ